MRPVPEPVLGDPTSLERRGGTGTSRMPVPPHDRDELTLLATLVAGEARNQPEVGMQAVAWVARNRMERGSFGKGWHGVILKPRQFSCFNRHDPNYRLLLDPVTNFGWDVWVYCYRAAAAAYFNLLPDPTGGADHYHARRKPRGAKQWPPRWAKQDAVTALIHDHVFYRLR